MFLSVISGLIIPVQHSKGYSVQIVSATGNVCEAFKDKTFIKAL